LPMNTLCGLMVFGAPVRIFDVSCGA